MNSRRMIQTTLGLEIAVVVFAACAAFGLRIAPPIVILALTVGVVVVALAAIALSRGVVGIVLGSLIPVALLAAGIALPLIDLVILGVVFAALWVTCLIVARRLPS